MCPVAQVPFDAPGPGQVVEKVSEEMLEQHIEMMAAHESVRSAWLDVGAGYGMDMLGLPFGMMLQVSKA